jgi:polyisoprenoid-binding protein YceI
MSKYIALFALAGIFALAVAGKPASTGGSWLVDAHHSDAQLTTDGTTDYGKTKINVPLGIGRVVGQLTLTDEPTKSSVDFSIYPAMSMAPEISEDGQFLSHWLANLSNHTLVCFHSKEITRKPDGRLQATGTLVLTRVDRNIEATPNEAYAGPVYGPPMIHRVTHEAVFVFTLPADASGQKDVPRDGEVLATGSTSMYREDFPQLLRAVVGTYWPPVVQDKHCQAAAGVGEDYHGSQCTGTFLETPALPEAPRAGNAEDHPGPANFNTVVGNKLTILVHLRLAPKGAAQPVTASGN